MKDFNYFAEQEQAKQEQFKQCRDRCFSPVVNCLRWLGITPNWISFWGMLCLAPFAWMLFAFPEPSFIALACVFLALHVLFDGIDGPLARALQMDGPAGAFIDMCCDHAGVIVVTWIISAVGLIDGTIGNIYVGLYTIAIVFIVWLNALGQPFRFVLRSKYLVFLLIFVYGITGKNFLDLALVVFSVSNLVLCLLGFFRIARILGRA